VLTIIRILFRSDSQGAVLWVKAYANGNAIPRPGLIFVSARKFFAKVNLSCEAIMCVGVSRDRYNTVLELCFDPAVLDHKHNPVYFDLVSVGINP
jgi:hypothetical protein